MKLWQKDTNTDKLIENFTVGQDREMDVFLAPHDVLGSMAHITMLETIGLLEKSELDILLQELKSIYENISLGKFVIESDVEDVHSQIEVLLTRKLGDIGKKIHSGRSRNDQVLLDMKLFTRDSIEDIAHSSNNLFDLLSELSDKYKDHLLPGYTHLQLAMPSSFGLWLGAYAESLADDMLVLQSSYRIANKNPLGSAAGYGSSFPLNRTLTTELLGFEDLNYNVVYAQMGRGKTEYVVACALSSIANTVGRLAMDVCLYMNQNFGFITFPDNLTTGSSIMPHKKNPDVFELIRARCNQIKTLPQEILNITSNLPSGYHRDLQQIKESFIPVFGQLESCLELMQYMLKHIQVKNDLLNDEKYIYLFSVERVNELVLSGIPFRDAYKQVGSEIADKTFSPPTKLNHTHEGSIGNLMTQNIRTMMKKNLSGFNFEVKNSAIKALLK
ncbi:MAG: argininosuccinate lyase [Opitutaceae bacterium]|nr:argininosuccinate lyase [Cytophagales bacterium]